MEEDLKNGKVANNTEQATVQVNPTIDPAIPEDFGAYPPVIHSDNKTYTCL